MRSFSEQPPNSPGNDWQTIRSMLPYVWEHKPRVIAALTCLIIAKAAIVATPWILKDIVDHLSATDLTLALPLTLLIG